MASDDAVYGILLATSVPFGFLMRATHGVAREFLGALLGVLMACIVCRWHALHLLAVTGVGLPLLLYAPRSLAPRLLFAWCFGYLVFFRTCHYFGMAVPTGHSNAVQMLLTLKLVGLAGELYDTDRWQRQQNSPPTTTSEAERAAARLQLELHGVTASGGFRATRVVSYCFCYAGLLTGPFYKFRTYVDMLESDSRNASWRLSFTEKAKDIILFGAVYFGLSAVVNTSYAMEDDFYERPVWWRHGYLMLLFARYRARMYAAWLLSECVCVAAALGAYPVEQEAKSGVGPTTTSAAAASGLGPPDDHQDCAKDSNGSRANHGSRSSRVHLEVDYETVKTIDPWTVETCPTFRETLRAWNQTVQWWLAANVYVQLRIRSKAARRAVVMLVSAFWHGIYGGYYATFITLPVCLLAEDLMAQALRSRLTSPFGIKAYDRVAAFLKMRYFEYISVGPLLLTWDASWRYWKSTYFVPHACIAGVAFVAWCFTKLDKSTKKKS